MLQSAFRYKELKAAVHQSVFRRVQGVHTREQQKTGIHNKKVTTHKLEIQRHFLGSRDMSFPTL